MIQAKNSFIQQRYDCLDGLRALLALYVVVHHEWLGVTIECHTDLSRWFFPLTFGRSAVCFFIVLSGFCLMLPTLDKGFELAQGIGRFIQRRAWRILPPYYFALFLSVLVDLPINQRVRGTGWDLVFPVTGGNLASHVLLVHNFILADMYKINGALWSIPVEWQIYFVFPLLLFLWRRIGPWAATVATVVISMPIEYELNARCGIAPTVHFVGLFALGMAAAYVVNSSRYESAPWRMISLILTIALAGSSYAGANKIVTDTIFGLLAASLLVVAFFNPEGWFHRALIYKPLVSVGAFSYSLYLVHAPILQTLWLYALKPLALTVNPSVMCVAFIILGTAICIPGAWLFYWLCERPFLRIRERKVVHIS